MDTLARVSTCREVRSRVVAVSREVLKAFSQRALRLAGVVLVAVLVVAIVTLSPASSSAGVPATGEEGAGTGASQPSLDGGAVGSSMPAVLPTSAASPLPAASSMQAVSAATLAADSAVSETASAPGVEPVFEATANAPPAQSAFAGDVTLVTTLRVDDLKLPMQISLAAFRTEEAPDAPVAFGLTWSWSTDGSSWFPTWALSLVSEVGLLPGGETSMIISSAGPARGHEYQTILSYSPSLGALAIRVTDQTLGRVIYADTLAVDAYGGPLYVVSNGLPKSDGALIDGTPVDGEGLASHGVTLEGTLVSLEPVFIPASATWSPGTGEPGGSFVSISIFETKSEPAAIRLRTPPPFPPGEFRVYLEYAGTSHPIAAVTPSEAETWIPLPLAEAPLGESLVRVDYVHGGQTLLTETRPIVVGRINVWFEPPVVVRDQGRVEVPVRLASSEPAGDEVQVELVASIEKLVWDAEERKYSYEAVSTERLYAGPVDLSTGEARLIATMPLPAEEGSFRARFQPVLTPAVASYVNGAERLFSTYAPAEFSPEEPYTFVVFPDTQYYSARHPHVFTRMTHWVAEHAAQHNIAAVLHVGDITDDNSAGQWDNAQRSMSLLQGVVPYVLAIGNHDMIGPKGTYGRNDSRINAYFPFEEAKRYSNLGGTMVPGRMENSYSLFDIAGDKYLVVSLEFGPPDEAVAWANEVVEAHPDHKVIYLTHSYLSPNGNLSSSPLSYPIAENPETTVNAARDLWQKLIRRHANSLLVLSGHVTPEVPTVPYRISQADAGQWVYQLLFDFQWEKPYDGNGWLGLLTFYPDGMLQVRLYSPLFDEWGDYQDTHGFTSHMWIDLRHGTVVEREEVEEARPEVAPETGQTVRPWLDEEDEEDEEDAGQPGREADRDGGRGAAGKLGLEADREVDRELDREPDRRAGAAFPPAA